MDTQTNIKPGIVQQRGTLAAILCMVLDQAQKFYMLQFYHMEEKGKLVVNDFFNLVMVWNRGISFGMFQGLHYSNYFFMGFTTCIVIVLFCFLRKSTFTAEGIAIGMIIGGALGNLIDRVRLEAVADFFDFHIGDNHWPAFNIADSCVFCGAVLLIICSLFKPSEKKNAK